MDVVGVVGLGYVGLPLAVALGRKTPTIGFDLNREKVETYRCGEDPTGEVSPEDLRAAGHLVLTSDPADLAKASVIIVAVPTPIDDAHRPDLTPLKGACRIVGENMAPGTTVVFESTVYPGCTEEVCVPILEQASGFRWASRPAAEGDAEPTTDETPRFFVGYSPERINPGDKEHRLETIVKVVAGDCEETLAQVARTYELIVSAGVHRTSSIKVAEAAKVIENTQRDLNIALMNELAMIFEKLDIDTLEVLKAAGTKWNFLPFRPGLVGGHCIGVDPYYLTYKAEQLGYHPQVILAGRRINDGMGKFVAEQTVKQLIRSGHFVNGSTVNVLGLTFKEDCPDLRNSRVADIIHELESYGCVVSVHDPIADTAEAQAEYGVALQQWEDLPAADAVVVAVAHSPYRSLDASGYQAILRPNGVIVDVKSIVDTRDCAEKGIGVWRL